MIRQTKTREVCEAIRREFILSGDFYNQLLPAEQALTERFGVSIVTVRRAVDELVREGLLEKRQGSRTAVVMPASAASRTIAVMIPEMQISPSYFYMGTRIANLLRRRGHQVQVFAGKDTDAHELLRFQESSDVRLEGAVICGYLVNHRMLRGANFPYVLAGGEGRWDMDNISFDLRSGVIRAMEYLLAHGHRRILFVSNYFDDGPHIESLRRTFNFKETARFMGYADALFDAGIEVDENLVLHGGSGKRSAYLAMTRKWKQDGLHGATAILASTDFVAEGIMQALNEAGLRVPEDISLVSCTNQLDPNDSLFEPLTTLDLRYDEVAVRAVDMILDRIEHPVPADDVYVSYCLIPKLLLRSTVAEAKPEKV